MILVKYRKISPGLFLDKKLMGLEMMFDGYLVRKQAFLCYNNNFTKLQYWSLSKGVNP